MQLRRRARACAGARPAAWLAGAFTALCCALVAVAQPAQALPASAAAGAARVALDHGDRTAVAVLDLRTGAYSGAGEDTAAFPSESVVKVFIAVRLLLTGQMTGATEATAYRMITASDDAAATALYARAGGDAVVGLVAAHYGIPDLGSAPPVPGRWGLTRITARGLVRFYAAAAKDPAVAPWLRNAMRHASRTAADGTDQFFGLPSADPHAAVKQGWGHDGVDAGHAVINSTGYVDGGGTAVAILTTGPPASYGGGLERVVTAQARALLAGLHHAAASPAHARAAVAGAPAHRDEGSGVPATAVLAGLGGLVAAGGLTAGATRGGRLLRGSLASWRDRRRARRRCRRAPRRPAHGHPLAGRLVRLPSGQLVRLTAAPPRRPSGPVRAPARAGARTWAAAA